MKATGIGFRTGVLASSDIRRMMGLVLLALVPGAAAQVWLEGPARAVQVALAVAVAVLLEALSLIARRRALAPFLTDLSAPLTGLLVALVLPTLPWWQITLAVGIAIVMAKHVAGGLGENQFNPAMLGVAAMLLLFPDAGASPAAPSLLPAALFAAGGIFLLARGVITWHAPVGLLASTVLASLLLEPTQLPALLAGNLALAAFFIVTDPVTGCLSGRGRAWFGVGVGTFSVLMLQSGAVPDALAFAVLLMNAAVPWLDAHTRPRRG